jgi:hypothetical protein
MVFHGDQRLLLGSLLPLSILLPGLYHLPNLLIPFSFSSILHLLLDTRTILHLLLDTRTILHLLLDTRKTLERSQEKKNKKKKKKKKNEGGRPLLLSKRTSPATGGSPQSHRGSISADDKSSRAQHSVYRPPQKGGGARGITELPRPAKQSNRSKTKTEERRKEFDEEDSPSFHGELPWRASERQKQRT